ncbi:MAG: ribose-phosphate diphosphokinase [Gammaproteobacteria bacterium]|nr:ribose-phosphate diphosphokinase [Gammaproteobacteria bacterium]
MFHEPLLLGFPDYQLQAKNLARLLKIEYAEAELHYFPDGESKIRLPIDIPSTVVICRSLDSPNDKLIELFFTVKELRQKGCERIILVAPYLCYMRQDKEFQPGEAVSQRWVGRLLASLVDEVITVDPHLHRVKKLEDIIKTRRVAALSAASLIGNQIALRVSDPLIIGPDEESKQWVEQIAQLHDFNYLVGDKTRLGDRDVNIVLPPSDVKDRTVVLVDDMASTGKTLINTAQQLKELGVDKIYCAITHALFVGDSYHELLATGVKEVWSTDSVSHSSNCISLASLLADTIRL